MRAVKLVVFATLSVLGTTVVRAERRVSLEFRSCFLAGEHVEDASRTDRDKADVVMLADLSRRGLGWEGKRQARVLKQHFGLRDLDLLEETEWVEVSGESWTEMVQSGLTVAQTLRMRDEDYALYLVPRKIEREGSRVLLEVYRILDSGEDQPLRPMELVEELDIDWDFGGPLAIAISFGRQMYFVTLTIRANTFSYGGRLASGYSWLL
jgi:hypothetical protein